MHPVFSLSPPSLPRRKGWGPYWSTQMLVGVTGWWAQVWACWGEGRNQLLTFFPFLSLSENISWGLAESCCTCHTHFSSLCAFSVSVTYCWETEFNQWPPALLINCLLLSIGSGDTGTGPQTGVDIFCSMSCLYWQEQFLAIRLLQQAVNLGQQLIVSLHCSTWASCSNPGVWPSLPFVSGLHMMEEYKAETIVINNLNQPCLSTPHLEQEAYREQNEICNFQ